MDRADPFRAFACSLFKKVGRVNSIANADTAVITLHVGRNVAEQMSRATNTPYEYNETDSIMTITGSHALDFMYSLDPTDPNLLNWLLYNPRYFQRNLPPIQITKTHPDAVMPSKTRVSDAGYDLTVIAVHKEIGTHTKLYDTGIRLEMPQGIYAEIVPRSSMSKSGYMLANSIGIIDNTYRGNIYVALTKVDPNAPDAVLPWRCCQLIFRHQVHVDLEEVRPAPAPLSTLGRGEGGFGSTGV